MASLYESFVSHNVDSYVSTTRWTGESWTPLVGHVLTQFKFYLRKASGATGTLTIQVKACSGELPAGAILSQTTYNIASLSTSAAWVAIDLPPFQVFAGVKYATYIGVVSGSPSQPVFIGSYNTGGYARGRFLDSFNAGVSWSSTSGQDVSFEDWGDPTIIDTAAATGMTDTAATLNGNLSSISNIDEVGFDYGLVSGSYTDAVTTTTIMAGAFGLGVTGLLPGRGYYYRAKAHHTTYGWLYGPEMALVTTLDPSWSLYENYDAAGTTNHLFSGNTWRGETFTPSFGHQLRGIKIKGYVAAGSTGTLTVSIRATSGGKPTGADLCSCALPQSCLPTSLDWIAFGFGVGITLSPAVMYAIVVRSTTGVNWRIRVGGIDAYPGYSQYSVDAGVSWSGYPADDYMFKEYGNSGIETYPASEIKAFSAQGNGYMADFTNIDQTGFEWSDGGFPWGGTYPNSVTDSTVPGSAGVFGMTMMPLLAVMTYYYRAKVHHTLYGWLYGNQQTFMTTPPIPGVRTDPPSDAQYDHIDAVGYIVWGGESAVDARGFVYGLTSRGDPGDATAPEDCLYDDFTREEPGPYGVGSFTAELPDLLIGRRYYVRAWAHNSYGYAYGEQIMIFTNPNVNFLFPNSDYSKNIRNDTGPGGSWPHHLEEGELRIAHYLLMRGRDSAYHSAYPFGYLTGKYIYEKDDWNDNLYYDLFGMTNPYRRSEGIKKIKWRAFTLANGYGYGEYYAKLYINSTMYTDTVGANNVDDQIVLKALNPNTSLAWTVADLDAIKAGIEIGEEASFGITACDYLQLDVLWADAAVVTDGVSNYIGTAARLNGHITEDEGCECVVYFQWGLTTAYGTTTAEQAGYHLGDAFSQDITGLTETAKYHYRAVIKTDAGEIFYGADMVFPSPSYAGVWLGTEADPFQKEITNTVLGFRTERGRDEELGHAASGIAELTCDNDGGDYSPERTDGLYVGYLYVGAYLTILDELDDIVYYMFSGRIDSIEPFPEPDNRYAYILAVDGGDDLEVAEIETPLRVVTDEAVLVADVLDAAGWSAGKRSINAGVDILQLGWFHDVNAREAINELEESTRGFFCVDTEGNAIWQSRHYRVTGARLVSQFTFNESFLKIGYKWSKKNVKNRAKVTGSQYIEWDDDSTLWYAPANFAGAPFIPAGASVNIWASLDGPRSSSDALVKGTHWNANSQYDKSGDDLSDDITVTPTYYGQAIKFVVANAGEHDAYLVVPDSPPSGAPGNATLLVIGKIYEASEFTVVEEDPTSQTTYGKRTITVDAIFKSNYNDIQSYAQNLVAMLKDPLPTPVTAQFNAWTDYPDSTLKLQALTRKLSDRVTGISAHLGVNQDYYIDKIIHEYVVNEGSWIHLCSFVLSRAEGQAEGQFWILGEAGFSELGETTILGF
jgi:hypothetical protein